MTFRAALLAALVVLAGCQVDIRVNVSRAPRATATACAWTSINHSGVEECHVNGPYLTPADLPPADTSSHLEL